MMATVPHVISSLGLRKFQADGFLLTRVYKDRKYVLETAYIFVLWYLALYDKNIRGNRFHRRRNEIQEFCTEK